MLERWWRRGGRLNDGEGVGVVGEIVGRDGLLEGMWGGCGWWGDLLGLLVLAAGRE